MTRNAAVAAALAFALAAACDRPSPEADTNAAEVAEAAEPSTAGEPAAPRAGGRSEAAQEPAVSECLKQDGERIPDNRLKALGTEPFWAAGIEGRCVTYKTPEDQQGTRIWTRFEAAGDSRSWTGALDGRPFVLRIRPLPGCSDGMSDNRYPMAAALTVRGEDRTGCALEP